MGLQQQARKQPAITLFCLPEPQDQSRDERWLLKEGRGMQRLQGRAIRPARLMRAYPRIRRGVAALVDGVKRRNLQGLLG